MHLVEYRADSLNLRLKQAQQYDDWVRAVRKVLEKDEYEDFFIKHDVLYKDPAKEQIVVPLLMEGEIIEMHISSGIFPSRKPKMLLRSHFLYRS